jgi:outer membrane cobalamin receptor
MILATRRAGRAVPLSAALAVAAAGAGAQGAPRDTGRTRTLDTVVVTAERASATPATSAAAVTRLSAEALRRLPTQTVSAALELVPGVAVLHADALGDAPRLAIRGFYGGGETEYVTVLLDGVPLTGLATGQVNWDLVPLTALEAIEVVRGGASALYGDAAVGGVVNLVTRRDQRFATWRASAGALGIARAGGAVGGTVGGRQASAFGDVRRSTGFREHEARGSGTLGGSMSLASGPARTLTLSTLNHRRAFDEPGPLAGAALAASRRDAAGFYRFDDTAEQLHRLTLDGAAPLGAGRRVSGYLTGEYARTDAVRTVPLSPDFADTKARALRTARVVGSVQVEASGTLAGVRNRVVAGTDVAAGRLTSRYAQVAQGDLDAYAAASGAAGDLDARGRGSRAAAAAFASWEVVPVEALRLTLGGRLDWLEDRYAPRAPSEGATTRATRAAFSPRAGANLRYVAGARQTGHVYLSAGRAFKAPTMDQLFDQRTTPLPVEPYRITTSNAALQAQYGTSVEAGAYHRVSVAPGRLDARLSVSAYQMDMKDELDFDLERFRYVNLGRSRHRGVEAGLTLGGPSGTSAFATFTQQSATSRFGENAGRFLKAVPRRVLTAGLARTPTHGLAVATTVTGVRDVFLDDANTLELDPYARVDLRASYPLRGSRVSLNVQNLLGLAYSTTGFADPAGTGVTYYYPAAGRVVTVGLESRW